MKLVLYNDNHQVLDVREDLDKVKTGTNEVTWQGGSMKGIKSNFIILEDSVEIGDTVTEEILSKDKKSNFKKRDLEQENAELRARLENTETAIIALLDLV